MGCLGSSVTQVPLPVCLHSNIPTHALPHLPVLNPRVMSVVCVVTLEETSFLDLLFCVTFVSRVPHSDSPILASTSEPESRTAWWKKRRKHLNMHIIITQMVGHRNKWRQLELGTWYHYMLCQILVHSSKQIIGWWSVSFLPQDRIKYNSNKFIY